MEHACIMLFQLFQDNRLMVQLRLTLQQLDVRKLEPKGEMLLRFVVYLEGYWNGEKEGQRQGKKRVSIGKELSYSNHVVNAVQIWQPCD